MIVILKRFAIALCSSIFLTPAVYAEDVGESDPLREKAIALFEYEIKEWRSIWEVLGDEGEVVRTIAGSETMSWVLDGTAVEMISRTDGREDWNKAIKFYNPLAKEIVFIDVATNGDYWIMRQDPLTHVVQSEPTLRPDGIELMIRFTIVRKTDNEQNVIMEQSDDVGETWLHRTNQYMRRVMD